MRMKLLTTFVAAGLAPTAYGQFAYTATVLTVGQGANTQFNAFPTDINDDGLISGYTVNPLSSSNDSDQAVSWTPGFGYELNTRVPSTGFYGFGRATGVSSNGFVSGYARADGSNGGFVRYGGIGPADPTAAAGDLKARGIVSAYDVNAEGRVVGLNEEGQVVSFKPGANAQVQQISQGGQFVTGTAGIRPAFSINDRNRVAGTLLANDQGYGYATSVAPAPGAGGDFNPNPSVFGAGTELAGLNDLGSPTYVGRGDGGATVFYGQTGQRPATTSSLGVANDVNDRNVVVGRGVVNGGFTGFVSFNGYAVDLNTLVNLNGLGINATSIREATAINDRGQIVVRAGNARTDGYAIVLTPIPGTSQFTPRMPDAQVGNVSTFANAASGQWFDPVGENGLTYTMTSADTFKAILELPQGFDGISVTVDGVTTDLVPGGGFDFAPGVTSFTVNWASPSQVDFPIKIAFGDVAASFSISSVPEPTALGLLCGGAIVARRRRRACR